MPWIPGEGGGGEEKKGKKKKEQYVIILKSINKLDKLDKSWLARECDQQAKRSYGIGFTISVADWNALEDKHKTLQELNEKWCKI